MKDMPTWQLANLTLRFGEVVQADSASRLLKRRQSFYCSLCRYDGRRCVGAHLIYDFLRNGELSKPQSLDIDFASGYPGTQVIASLPLKDVHGQRECADDEYKDCKDNQ